MKLLYFAWVRQKVGCSEEIVTAPADVTTVLDLVRWLRLRGGGFGDAFADEKCFRVAVNQEHVLLGAVIGQDDEVAFFPPVTGG